MKRCVHCGEREVSGGRTLCPSCRAALRESASKEREELDLPWESLIIIVAELQRGTRYVRITHRETNYSASATGAEPPERLLGEAWERLRKGGVT